MPKFNCFFILLSLILPGQTAAGATDPVSDIYINVNLLQNNPQFLATDTLGIMVEAREEVFYKISSGDEIVSGGKLLGGKNPLLIRRPGMFARTQTLSLLLQLQSGDSRYEKTILIGVTVAGTTEPPAESKPLPRNKFTIDLFMAGQQIGFREKSMTDLLKLTTGLVTPVTDPGLSGSAIRSAPPSQSISLLGMVMGIAKQLAEKKLANAKKMALLNVQKRKLAVRFESGDMNGGKRTVQAEIELQFR